MLVRGNIPVCESINIIEYMEHEFDRTKLLTNEDDQIKEKYEKYKELHEAFDVEALSYGSILYRNWYLR